jgi:amino acid adenylation domain-containing protein
LRDGSTEINYRALLAAADELASELTEHGAGPDIPIGICIERSIEHVIAMLGALRAGSAFLPLDPAWPSDRMRRVLDDAATPIVIAGPAFADRLAAPNRVVLSSRRDARRAVAARDFAKTGSENLAYVIYTSGSTGEPKGVEITQGNLANLVAWHREAFAIAAHDHASWVAGLAFDASIWELFPYLTTGATVHLAAEEIRASADALRRWLIDEAISIAFVPAPLAEAMVTTDWPAQTRLHTLLTGGDTLHVRPKPGLPFKVVNNYGPTECTVVATSGIVEPREGSSGLPTIGRPISGARIEIRDSAGEPLAHDEIGEIYIAGANVGRGYRNRSSLTANKFVALVDSGESIGRFYRTGDLGCWTANGEIAFHGRCDDQLKLRGHRVEPDEISAVLSRHPLVAQSAVVAEGEGVDKRLLAYIVPAAQTAPRADELREFLAASLPHYMLPAGFVRVASLPLTANGKLDKSALPAPTTANTLSVSLYRAPSSVVESRVAAIVEELLGIRGVGIDDNFFLLGGHSLLGTQLVLRLRGAFGAEMTLRDLFEAQTIENLAARVEEIVVDMVVSMSEEELQEHLVH